MNWIALNVPACDLAESPRYAHGTWAWVDIHNKTLYFGKEVNSSADNTSFQAHPMSFLTHSMQLPDEIACILPTANPDTWIGLGREGVWKISENQEDNQGRINGNVAAYTHLQKPVYDTSKHRYNDGRADAQGRIWISSLVDARAPATAALYRLANGEIEQLVEGLIVGNGLAFTPDGKAMFLADTRHKYIWRYEYDLSTGTLGKRNVVHQYTTGNERPDGACMSTDGSYWVAILEGYRLDRFNSDGQFVESIPLPLAKPTMPCFGGPGLSTLLVTSGKPEAQHPNKEGFEHASLIACKTTFTGVAEAFASWPKMGTHL